MMPRLVLLVASVLVFSSVLAVPTSIGGSKPRQLATEDPSTIVSVNYDANTRAYSLQAGRSSGAVAWGKFSDGLATTGWGVLDIKTMSAFSDNQQAFAAGFAEGALTAKDIYYTYHNLYNVTFPDMPSPPQLVSEFMDTQENWTRTQVAANTDDPFWRQHGYIMRQFDGLEAGYRYEAAKGNVPADLPHFAFQLLNGVGDLFDIIPAVMPQMRVQWQELDARTAIRRHQGLGHCSALIKVTGNFSDLMMGHSSWFTFSNTNRIYKHYAFAFADASTAAQTVSFSSYPGFLESLDDFYLLSSGIGWTQTSNAVLDHAAYEAVVPQSLLAWQRVRVASAMATSAPHWHDVFKREHSGTYANQYMIVDFNLFQPGHPLVNNTFWVVEEMPGLVEGGDQTATLNRGYWPSYNVPFWQGVFNKSGYPPMVEKHGLYFSYEMAPRANIFRRDAGLVEDVEGLKAVLRSNKYRTDPYSFDGKGQNPMYAVCSRGDLAEGDGAEPMGCYDTKVTSHAFGAMNLMSSAINGPTRANNTLPPFAWSQFPALPHAGLPSSYEFDFVGMEPVAWPKL